MKILNLFKKSKLETSNIEMSLTLEEVSELCVGDKVKFTLDGSQEIITYVKPRSNESTVSFMSGHFISIKRWSEGQKNFTSSPHGETYRISNIILLERSDLYKSDPLSSDIATSLRPGWNYIGILDSNGYQKVKVDVCGQKLFWGDEGCISIDKLGQKGGIGGVYYFTLPETELVNVEKDPMNLSDGVLVDVYYKEAKYRVFRCWVKESQLTGPRLVLKHVNDNSLIVINKDPELTKYIIYPFDQMRVTA